jgi:hypothetical protein
MSLARGSATASVAGGAAARTTLKNHGAIKRSRATRVGIIFNRRAHRNLGQEFAAREIGYSVDWSHPDTEQDLRDALARFARSEIDTLVIDGGDGTIRDVLGIAPAYFRSGLPRVAIIPSGKTNALALDLGIPVSWSLDDALDAIAHGRCKLRSPIEIRHAAAVTPHLRGFLFGVGAFVDATAIAQDVHGLGGFRGVAVGLSLAAAITQTVFAGSNNRWRRGLDVRVTLPDCAPAEQAYYTILGTTLKRLPLNLRPFGRARPGVRVLAVEAPPRHLLATLPALLAGSEAGWLARFGYHHRAVNSIRLNFEAGFVLDGEQFPGGDLILSHGDPIEFVVA